MSAHPRVIAIATTAAAVAVTVAAFGPSALGAPMAPQVISNIAHAPAQPAGSQGHLLDLYLYRLLTLLTFSVE